MNGKTFLTMAYVVSTFAAVLSLAWGKDAEAIMFATFIIVTIICSWMIELKK